jgi:hypothetical protein
MASRVLTVKDYSEGTTKIIYMLSDLVEDTPKIHRLVYDYVLSPLQKKGILNLRFIRWSFDDDPTGSHVKLLALILTGHKQVSRGAWSDVVTWYTEEVKWKGVFTQKIAKLTAKDEVFAEVREEIGEEAAKVIMPLLEE